MRKPVSGRKQGKATSIRNEVVDAYIKRLVSPGLQRPAFDAVIGDLALDKFARKSEMIVIASKYVGVPLHLRSRKEALEVIKKRFVELSRFEKKQQIASKVIP